MELNIVIVTLATAILFAATSLGHGSHRPESDVVSRETTSR
jgi:hypothetical protein